MTVDGRLKWTVNLLKWKLILLSRRFRGGWGQAALGHRPQGRGTSRLPLWVPILQVTSWPRWAAGPPVLSCTFRGEGRGSQSKGVLLRGLSLFRGTSPGVLLNTILFMPRIQELSPSALAHHGACGLREPWWSRPRGSDEVGVCRGQSFLSAPMGKVGRRHFQRLSTLRASEACPPSDGRLDVSTCNWGGRGNHRSAGAERWGQGGGRPATADGLLCKEPKCCQCLSAYLSFLGSRDPGARQESGDLNEE